MASNIFNLEKLLGRANYSSWKFGVKTYLQHEGLWECIEREDEVKLDPSKDVKARTKIILLLDPVNYVHVQDATTAKDVWQNLEKAFDDNGLTRKVGLLKDLVTTTLDGCGNIEEYVNRIVSTAHKLRSIKFNIDDEWIGTLMLAGLPDTYKPMIMALESSGINITADAIKTKLIQEVKSPEPSAYFTGKKKNGPVNFKPKGPRCYNCNKYGHMSKFCRAPKKTSSSEQTKDSKHSSSGFVAAFSAFTSEMDNQWYIDSGAAMHMTKRCDWLYDMQKPYTSKITVANKTPLPVECTGKVDITVNENKKIQVRDVLFVPDIAVNLLSVSAMSKSGCKLIFHSTGCDVYNDKNVLVCSATLTNNLYRLNTDTKVHANLIYTGITDETILWHRRMGHVNLTDINKLPSCADGVTIPASKIKSDVSCTVCSEGKQSRLPFSNIGSRATQPLELIHSDLCGPMEILSIGDQVLTSEVSENDDKCETSSHSGEPSTSQTKSPDPVDSAGEVERKESSSEYDTDQGELDESFIPDKSMTPPGPRKMILRSHKQAVQNNQHRDHSPTSYFCYSNPSDPQSVDEALSSEQATEWKMAMEEEYSALSKNNTWTLVDPPPRKKVIPCKWVFKSKTDQNGKVTRYKARLVIKGYKQKKGIDYEEIYSPVVRYTSVRYLFALSVKHNLEIEQMDAVSAFLQGEIDSEIYMQQPPMYENGSTVCLLHKSIYGLKQASRLWNIKLDNVLKEIGLERSKVDPCIYYNTSLMIFIAVWVDDLIIFSSVKEVKDKIKDNLQKCFSMKDLGEVRQCIGLNVTRNRAAGILMIDQEKYIKEILSKFSMQDCKPVKTPIEVGMKFSQSTEKCKEYFPYQQAVGCLLYLAQATRPDISFAVNTLSRFNKNPQIEHWMAIKRVMRYLQGTKDYKLVYTKDGGSKLAGYCDADWASDTIDRKSCTGYIFLLQGGGVSWSSRRQQTVALSTAEAEYMAMASAAQEALWLRLLQKELGEGDDAALTIFSDNQSAIKLSVCDSGSCKPRTKHIDIRYHFLRDYVTKTYIKYEYCNGDLMIADILTKGTTLDKHLFCSRHMGLRSGEGVIV